MTIGVGTSLCFPRSVVVGILYIMVPLTALSGSFPKYIETIVELHARSDPTETPFKSKYEARDIINQHISEIQQLLMPETALVVNAMKINAQQVPYPPISLDAFTEDATCQIDSIEESEKIVCMATLYLYLGVNFHETEENKPAEEALCFACMSLSCNN